MPVRHTKSSSQSSSRDRIGRARARDNMETIWLQRSNPEMPWGFRMVGGREFGLPLTIQRVTPGSVAAAGLGPGDIILKVGNVMATNLEHNDAQELVRQSGNILQLTIRKPDVPVSPGPVSPPGSSYESQLSVQTGDYNAVPRGFGTGFPLNNNSPNYATIPKNLGSQNQTLQATRNDTQNVNIGQQRSGYKNSHYDDDNAESNGPSFPDYTLAYKKQEIVHDSPGGPDNIRGFIPPDENTSYSTKSLPRGFGGYKSSDADAFKEAGGPPACEPSPQNTSSNSFSPNVLVDHKFNTGIPYQSSPHGSQQYITTSPTELSQTSNKAAYPAFSSSPRPFTPPTSSAPLSPRNQTSFSSGFENREQTVPAVSVHSPNSSIHTGSSSFDQSSIHGSGSNTYSTLPHSKPSYSTNNNNSFNIYKSSPQPYSAPKPFAPTQNAPSSTLSSSPLQFTSSQQKPFQRLASQGTSAVFSSSQPVIRKVSFDQNMEENGAYAAPTNFTARPYRPVQPAIATNYSSAAHSRSNSQPSEDTKTDNGVLLPAGHSADFSQQSSKPDFYTSVPFSGPVSPRGSDGGYTVNRYDPTDISEGVNGLNMASARYDDFPPPASPSPPPPPPPPLPSGPPPPPPPPLNDWNPASSPYRRPNYQQSEEFEEQKIPDQLLSTMMQSAKSGGPKPFSYGIDLLELKKKIGPPTAPKPRPGQPNYQFQAEELEVTKQYGGPPKKPTGHIQSDYFIKRDDGDPSPKASKKPAGQIQSDYLPSRKTGPRSEIDESPININMGTNPKKQSKSFKVLQWMTETENDDTEELSQKPKRTKDPERRHNADDDEMRFTGLHSKAEIPSKAFGMLQRLSSNEDSSTAQLNGKATLTIDDVDEGNENFEDTSVRYYKGRNIPSPSFRVLQTWAESDPDPNITRADFAKEESEDDLPDTLNSEEMVDKRYTGGNIPSKVFKVLQMSLGEDISEMLPPPPNNNQSEDEPSVSDVVAPISEF